MTHFFRQLTLFSYFGLMFTLIYWIIATQHSEHFPTVSLLLLALTPLLFPLRGLLYGKPYTHAWTSFIMLFYFSHGIGEMYSTSHTLNIMASLEVIFSCLTFISCILFIKLNAKLERMITK